MKLLVVLSSPGLLQVVPWNAESLGGRKSTDSVQGELLPGEEQPDLQERLLTLTQVDACDHSLTALCIQSKTLESHIFSFECTFWACPSSRAFKIMFP